MEIPLVSIVTITYNHEPYIRKCIEGVLMQQVNFPIEFIIAEDCSTDGTRSICEEYAEKYPDVIYLLPSGKNYGPIENELRAFQIAKGKYIATCEGDDFWSEPLKLQKQVDFLEKNHKYSVCFHRYKKHYLTTGIIENDLCDDLFVDSSCEGVDVSVELFLKKWITQYLTMVFRSDSIDINLYRKCKYYRDSHLIYHLLLQGKGYLFNFFGGIYNITNDGIYSSLGEFNLNKKWVVVNEELYFLFNDNRLLNHYVYSLQHLIDTFVRNKKYKYHTLLYIYKHFRATHNVRRLLINLKNFLIK